MFSQLKKVFLENRSWAVLSLSFFLFGLVLSYFFTPAASPELLAQTEESAFSFMEELAELVFGGPPLRGVFILFFSNLITILQVIFFGILIGILPLLTLIINGALLGTVAVRLAQEGISPLLFFFAGILPHGILELPAFLFAAALGLKLGYHVLFPLAGKTRLESLKSIFAEIQVALPVLVVLLFIAAVIEVYITPGLATWLLDI